MSSKALYGGRRGRDDKLQESEQRTVRFTIYIPLFTCKSHSHSNVLNPGPASAIQASAVFNILRAT